MRSAPALIEARATLAFLPALAPHVLGEELKLNNVATWWLGRADVRDKILSQLDSMVIAPAFGTAPTDVKLGGGILGAQLDDRATQPPVAGDRRPPHRLRRAGSRHPLDHAGLARRQVQPRPFSLRLFLAKTGDKWQVMPGGFVRIAENADARAISLQRGDATADAWVLRTAPVTPSRYCPRPDASPFSARLRMLPSRAADNLFWVGRYIERAEATLRLARVMLNRVAEAEDAAAPVVASITILFQNWNAAPLNAAMMTPAMVVSSVLLDTELKGSLPRLMQAARAAASVIRERFSPDAWRAVNDLAAMIEAPLPFGPVESAMIDRVEAALRIISALSGLAQENMTQLAGWRFLELGRRIERALQTCRFVRWFAEADSPEGGLDVLLELADSQLTYRQRYVMIAAPAPVIDLVMLDPNNPRSVAYQIDRIEVHLALLPMRQNAGRLTPVQQVAAGLATASAPPMPTSSMTPKSSRSKPN